MKAIITFLIYLILPSAVYAAVLQPEDFAYGLPVHPETTGAIYSISIPEDVYRVVTQPNLKDIRVFNAHKEPVPHIIRRPVFEKEEKQMEKKIPFFPLYAAHTRNTEGLSVYFSTDTEGMRLTMTSRTADENRGQVQAYLLDLTSDEEKPDALKLTWKGNTGHFVTRVRVAASHDLDHWQTIVPSASLADLSYGSAQLERREITLPKTDAPYLRVSWPAGNQGATVTAFTALFISREEEKPREWVKTEGKTSKENDIKIFEYDTKGHFPTDRIKIIPHEPNSLFKGIIQSRNTPEGSWQPRHQGTFYYLEMDGVSFFSDDIRLNSTPDRWWRIKIIGDDGGIGDHAPMLEIGWIPHDLLFLARGKEPFTLAYGNAGMPSDHQSASGMLDAVEKEEQDNGNKTIVLPASLGSKKILGGPERLTPPKPPFPWKQWLLWGVLVLGVICIGWMVWRLQGQMKQSGSL